ncbi:YqgE/AlgH family protein [Planctomycetota bacterium]|nr:YqgE/AlgH family protein [Planctomycetota bacterium]
MQQRQGQILISSTDMLDPNFHQTLTLLVKHDEQGALGLTLNRPLEIDFKDAWAQVADSPCNYTGPLMLGGPCEGPLMVLHDNIQYAEETVMEGVYFTTEPEDIAYLLEHHTGQIKCFTSYSGWGPLQLEGELEIGSWVTIDATPNLIFNDNPSNQWMEILKKINPGQATIYQNPDLLNNDPNLN